MTTRTLAVALATAFLGMGAASVQAQTPGPAGDVLEVRVINQHTSAVRVYVEDVLGRVRSLGWVNHADARTLTLPTSMTKLGPVQIKVLSDQPVWSPRDIPPVVATMPLELRPGDVVEFRLQGKLTDSYIHIARS